MRLRVWRIREAPKILVRKANKIRALWWRYKTRLWYVPWKAKKKSKMAVWRRAIQSCCHLRLGKLWRPFQKMFKLRYFNGKRFRAAELLNKRWRGYDVRKRMWHWKQDSLSRTASRIQQVVKRKIGRLFRRRVMSIEHMAAYRIQRVIHTMFDGEALMRIERKRAIRRREEIIEEKKRLLLKVRQHALNKRKDEFMFIFARRIQKRFRRWTNGRRKKAEAMANREKAKEDATEEIIAIKTGKMFQYVNMRGHQYLQCLFSASLLPYLILRDLV